MPKKPTKSKSRSGGGASSAPEEPPANVSRPLKRAECAELLGVPADCKDEDVIKKAYRTAALKTHPDKGGSEEAFKRVNEAYTKMKAYANGEPAGEDNFDEDGGGVTEADYDDFIREMMFQMGGGGMGGLGFMFSQMFGSSPPRKRRGFMPRKSATKGKRMNEDEDDDEEEEDDDDDEENEDNEDVFEDDDDDIDFFEDIFGKPKGRRPVFGGGRGTRRPPKNTSEAFFVPGVGFVEVSDDGSGGGGGGKGRRKTPKPGSAEYVKAFAEKNKHHDDEQEQPETETTKSRTKKQVKTK
jgi:curved DNA-binding protein CbpA